MFFPHFCFEKTVSLPTEEQKQAKKKKKRKENKIKPVNEGFD